MEMPRYPPVMQTDISNHVTIIAPVVVAPQPTLIVPLVVYRDYMTRSILNLIFCFFPLAIVALLNSIKTREANAHGDPVSAARYSSAAYSWNNRSLGVGICVYIVWIVCVTYFNVKL